MLSLSRLSNKNLTKILKLAATTGNSVTSLNSNLVFNKPICRHGFSINTWENSIANRLFSTSPVTYASDSQKEPDKTKRRRLPPLMDFTEIVWPSLFKSIKNWILVTFIIRPYFDNNFQMQEFVAGSNQALEIISTCISTGTDIDSLQGLVSDEALEEIKQSVSAMNMKQRYEIECRKGDIYFSFPYQVGIMFDESNKEVQRRWVEITMVYHVLKGAKEMADRNEQIPMNIGLDPDYQEKFSICNYRFIKEFTQNQQTDWIVNKVNHFKPIDLIESNE